MKQTVEIEVIYWTKLNLARWSNLPISLAGHDDSVTKVLVNIWNNPHFLKIWSDSLRDDIMSALILDKNK